MYHAIRRFHWFLAHLQSCAAITTINLRAFPSPRKETPSLLPASLGLPVPTGASALLQQFPLAHVHGPREKSKILSNLTFHSFSPWM